MQSLQILFPKRTCYSILIICFLLSACQLIGDREVEDDNIPIARVYNQYLYLSDLSGLINDGMAPRDSIDLVNNYINSWVNKKVIHHKAQQFLPDDRVDIEKQVKDYEESLFVHTYERELIRQKLDTLITEQQINRYYNEFQNNFHLNSDMLKASYLMIDSLAPKQEPLEEWLRNRQEHKEELLDYCYQYSQYFSIEAQWMVWQDFRQKFPIGQEFPPPKGFYKNHKGKDRFYVLIEETTSRGKLQPIDLVKEDIIKILVNKRKIEFVKEIHRKAYIEARDRSSFEIFEIASDKN